MEEMETTLTAREYLSKTTKGLPSLYRKIGWFTYGDVGRNVRCKRCREHRHGFLVLDGGAPGPFCQTCCVALQSKLARRTVKLHLATPEELRIKRRDLWWEQHPVGRMVKAALLNRGRFIMPNEARRLADPMADVLNLAKEWAAAA